jgi:hypothetical protein
VAALHLQKIKAGIAGSRTQKCFYILNITNGFGMSPEFYKGVCRDVFRLLVVVNKFFNVVVNEKIKLIVGSSECRPVTGR